MSDRTEKKLQEVPIARYAYRHEAEFAAGFLDDAGIPYRLQLDDPAIGLSVGAMATIWVRGMDVRRVREILEVDVAPTSSDPNPHGGASRTSGRSLDERRLTPDRGMPAPMTGRERSVSLLLAAGLVVSGQLFLTASDLSIVRVSMAVLAAAFGVAGIIGRAPRVLRRILGALSGDAPKTPQ